ncbi:sortase domain-bontaining protein [uncultured Vagococcus sp.]|uniref:sortase domain-containing protein n=1 Tax=uncultured Vagococcus sp. TaxID=189676 RepID=UPI0028D560BC|nr:sortase [uncultured Vagococcus sp.]
MKKNILISGVALAIVMSLAGTLSYIQKKELTAKEVTKETVITEKKDSEPPVINGQKNWVITQGQPINVLEGVTATDNVDKTVKLTASDFSNQQVGSHDVIITAEDGAHNKTTKTIVVQVNAPEKIEDLSDEQPVINEVATSEALVYEKAAEPQVEETQPSVSEPTWTANTLYLGGIAIPYQNAGQSSGQSVIDNNPNMVATWGGAALQSGSDGANTHFIGHNPGIFNVLFSLGGGSQIIVTDSNGTPTYYTVNQVFQVDDYGTGVADGQSYIDQITGTGGGERITLQTCVNDDINLIVMASAS